MFNEKPNPFFFQLEDITEIFKGRSKNKTVLVQNVIFNKEIVNYR